MIKISIRIGSDFGVEKAKLFLGVSLALSLSLC